MKLLRYTFIVLLISACKSQKTLSTVTDVKSLSTAKIVKQHNNYSLDQNTIKARLKIRFEKGEEKADATAKLRLEKDKNIWISVTKTGIPFAKIHITKTKVRYYEKLNKVYFDGDFSLLNSWLGTDFDFQKIQNLLLGKAIYKLNKKELNSKIVGKSYELKPITENDKFTIAYYINPSHFRVDKEVVVKKEKEESLNLEYHSYQKIDQEIFPKKFSITTNNEGLETWIALEYKSVEFNKKLTFPFAIPKGYKEIEIKL